MNLPEISIIIPTYNRAEELYNALQSVSLQTFKNFEVLICDDGSNDNSEEIVKSFQDQRFQWLPGGRGGKPAIPRNRGIAHSRGKWIAFLDSDDIWNEKKLEIQLNELKKTDLKACCSNAIRYISKKKKEINFFQHNKNQIKLQDMLELNYVICSSMILHRSIIDITGGFSECEILTAIEDYHLWLKVSTITDIQYIDKTLVWYKDEPHTSIRKDGETNDKLIKRNVIRELKNWQNYPQLSPHLKNIIS